MSEDEFIKILRCWIKKDLEHMLKIEDENGCGGCNFPIVLYTLSCMDWLGFLLRDCEASKTQLKNTSANIDSCLNYFPNNYQDPRIRKILKSLFRNGLVHQFGPKYGGISRGNELNPPIQLMPRTFAPFLDADQLANSFIDVLDEVADKILSHQLVFSHIRNKLDLIFKEDYKEFKELIASL